MTTHRSLNKLEFKAHMSIHNFKDVEEGEAHDLNGTRDRFGKSHQLSDSDGTPRIRARKRRTAAAVLFLGAFFPSAALAEQPNEPIEVEGIAGTVPVPPMRRNTDVRVDSEATDANDWLNAKLNKPEPSFSIPIDQSSSLGFNEDGDPALSSRF